MGRKRKINEDNMQDIADDYAKGEMRIKDICKKHDVSVSTWYDTLNAQHDSYNSEFSELIKNADKKRMDNLADLAEVGMKKLLQGYEYEEVQRVIEPPENGNEGEGKVKEIKRTKKQVKPDRVMIMFVATNRAPRKWKHRSQIGISNVDDKPLKLLQVTPDDVKDMDASSLTGLFEDEES